MRKTYDHWDLIGIALGFIITLASLGMLFYSLGGIACSMSIFLHSPAYSNVSYAACWN